MRSIRADRNTLAAVYTFMAVIGELGGKAYSLRIVTPEAREWTTLEEYGSSYAVTVVNGKSFYFKNVSFHFIYFER
jgi:hypothetical protein